MLFTKRIKNCISLYSVMIISLTAIFCRQRVNLMFEKVNGLVAVEAEHYFSQEKSEIREWYFQKSSQGIPGNFTRLTNNA